MFLVRPEIVNSLLNIQRPALRGQLRLDLSSRRFPADVRKEIDLAAAPEAVGERVVRLLLGLANDAALLSQTRNWRVPEKLPKPDDRSRLLVMPDPKRFEPYVVARIDEQLGLDPANKRHEVTVSDLAWDFYVWAARPAEEPDAKTYGISAEGERVFIACRPYQPSFTPDGSFQPAEVRIVTPKTRGG